MSDDTIYLDHAATTRPFASVTQTIADTQRQLFGNPSSQHAAGRAAKKLLEDARAFLRGSLGAADLVFTSGGTEADQLGVVGPAFSRPPGRVLAAASDHAAVLGLERVLAARRYGLVRVPVTPEGDIDPETLFEHLGKDVRVVSLLHGHNELGTLCRLDELVEVVRHVAPEAHIHVDLVQSYGKIDFDLDLAGVDSVAVSGHKLHGPRGIGFLATSSTARYQPLMEGGGQEGGRRGGTENVPGAVGLARAAERMLTHLGRNAEHCERLAARFFDAVVDEFPEATRLGAPDRRVPHILSMRIPGVVGQTLQQRVDTRGLSISTGSACHDGKSGASHVLEAIGLSTRDAREVVRVSFSAETTYDEADRAVDILVAEADRLLHLAGGAAR